MSLMIDLSVLPTFDVRGVILEEGELVLKPLEVEHAEDLMACTEPDTFEWFTYGVEKWDLAGFEDYIRWRNQDGMATLGIWVGGVLMGASSYFDWSVKDRRLEIGHTFLASAVRGSWVNPRMKRLMIGHAIEEWGALRVQLKTDGRNLASQKAMTKCGFVYEGVLRNMAIMPDGFCRDSVYFSVCRQDWDEVREKLVALEQSRSG